MWSSILVWELRIPAPIYVLLVFVTFLLQQHERSYNLHRCSSVSLRWAGTSGFRFATVGALSVPFGSRVRWESLKASGSRPESCLFPLVFQPLYPESDSRWKVASCWRVVCLTGLIVVGDQFRYGFHSSVVDSMPLIGVSWIRVCRRGCSQRHTLKLRWHDRLWPHSGHWPAWWRWHIDRRHPRLTFPSGCICYNFCHLFANYVRLRAEAREDGKFFAGDESGAAVGQHCLGK